MFIHSLLSDWPTEIRIRDHNGNKKIIMIYGAEKSSDIRLFGYTDSNFAADTSNRRSTTVYSS
jgi:hypothetical protein